MKAWLRLVSIGVIGGSLASACVITSDDGDDDDNEGGEGGDESTGGRRPTGGSSATGDRATGGTGTGGATGGTATGGTATGGRSPDACDIEEFEPADSCAFEDGDACTDCLSGSCCAEIKDCYADDPLQNRCGYPIVSGEDSEFDCSIACLLEIAAEGDVPTEDDVDECAGSCMTCSLPNFATIDLSQCLVASCFDECLGE